MATLDDTRLPALRDWAVAHDRRVHAARIARRLQPGALLLGGYASSRLRVRLPGEAERRPAAVLALGEPPATGVSRDAPLLVIDFAPVDAGWWLARGCSGVWGLEAGGLRVHRSGRVPVTLLVDDEVGIPGAGGFTLKVRPLLPKADLLDGGTP
jgi:hypothetical protein